jgi:hypothetical protein
MRTPARTAEDIIGIVPHTLGYTPRSSLVAVIVGTEGNGAQSSSTTLRIDFNRETAADIITEGGGWYANLISRVGVITGLFFLVYDEDYIPVDDPDEVDDHGPDPDGADDHDPDAEYADIHRRIVRAAIDELAMTFGARGIDILSAWWVSHDRFGRIDEDGRSSTPLIEATSSACAAELVASGSNPVGAAEDLVIAPVAADVFSRSRRGRTDEWMSIEEAFVVFAELYPRLEAMRGGDEPFDEARLHALMDLPAVMALDALLAEKWSRDSLEMILSFDHPAFLPTHISALDGPGLQAACRTLSREPSAAHELIGLSARAPQPRDVLLSIAFLKEYLPVGHPHVRATAYAVIGWFEWALGGSTMANNYALAALKLDPEHKLAQLIDQAVSLGFLPRWLMDTEAARF